MYYRVVNNITREELADKTGSSVGEIINFEKGFSTIHFKNALLLAEVLSISPDELMEEYTQFCKPGYGRKIKIIRNAYGVSQKEFANMISVDRSTVSIWEAEINNLHPGRTSFNLLKELAFKKGIDIKTLIENEDAYSDAYEAFIQDNCGRKISEIRKHCGLKMSEFADLLGLACGSTISQWESEKTHPNRKNYDKLKEIAQEKGIVI